MVTPKPSRRISQALTSDEQRQAVERMLHEIAYVLHVTRKVNRDIPWPITVPVGGKTPQSGEKAPATAV